MKTFGLFQPDESEPILTYEGAVTIQFGKEVAVFGGIGKDGVRRIVIVITLREGRTVREVK